MSLSLRQFFGVNRQYAIDRETLQYAARANNASHNEDREIKTAVSKKSEGAMATQEVRPVVDNEWLYTEYHSLLSYMANRYRPLLRQRGDLSVEDLEQAGYFGLLRAAEIWREGGKTFIAWAKWHIIHEINIALGIRYVSGPDGGQRYALPPIPVSLDEPLHDAEGTTLSDLLPDERIPDADEAIFADGLAAFVRGEVDKLPDVERTVIRARYFQDMSYEQIQRRYSMPRAKAYRTEANALWRMRRSPGMRRLRAEMNACGHGATYHNGRTTFERSHTSATERAALKI